MIGSIQDLSGPIAGFGKQVRLGMMLRVDEINEQGGINGRKLRLIAEDSAYDPKKAVLASQKLVEKDKIFAMVGPMGSPTVIASQDILFDAGVLQLFPLTAAELNHDYDIEQVLRTGLLPQVQTEPAHAIDALDAGQGDLGLGVAVELDLVVAQPELVGDVDRHVTALVDDEATVDHDRPHIGRRGGEHHRGEAGEYLLAGGSEQETRNSAVAM